jgi:hypothetical protein
LFFPRDGPERRSIGFVINEVMQLVPFSESFYNILFVLFDAMDKIARDANIEKSARLIG